MVDMMKSKPSSPYITTQKKTDSPGVKKALVVDDNMIDQRIAARILAALGFDCDIFNNAARAVKAVQQHNYAFIFMKLHLPVMDGWMATREIRAMGFNATDLPIFAMTTDCSLIDCEQSKEAGLNACFSKPMDLTTVSKAMARWVTVDKPEDHTDSNPQDCKDDKNTLTIPGLDTDDALMRLDGDQELFTRILANYHDENINLVTLLRTQILAGNHHTAAQALHSLKGSSGNIGARQVYKQAGTVEDYCRNKQSDEALAGLEYLNANLQEVLDGIKQNSHADTSSEYSGDSTVEFEEVYQLCRQLIGHLERDLGKAQSCMKTLTSKTAGSIYAQAIRDTGKALDKFDIDGAKSILSELLSIAR